MSKFLCVIYITFISVSLLACTYQKQPEVIESKTLKTSQEPYFITSFILIKQHKICLLKTTSSPGEGTIITKSWGVSKNFFYLVEDSSLNASEPSYSSEEGLRVLADQQIEEQIKQMRINKEIYYLKTLLSTHSKKQCGIK
jgi:hypothetical protein